MSLYGSDSTAGDTSRQIQQQQEADTLWSQTFINNSFAGYNDKFYNQRRTDYLNYALPEINKQYGDERKNVIYGLANRGLVKSGAANEQFTNLGKALTTQQQGVVDAADTAVNNLKTQISTAKNTLLSQLGTAASPSTTAVSALSSAATFNVPIQPTVSSNAFGDFANALSTRYQTSNLGATATSPSGGASYTGAGYSAPIGGAPNANSQPDSYTVN